MAKPYSMDLRERAVARVEAGESVRSVAEALDISVSSVVKWWQRKRRTGSVAPGKMGGHRPRKIAGDHHDWLAGRIASGAFTLRGLVAELAGRGLDVDQHTVWTFVHEKGLSFKKKRFTPASGTGRMWQGGGRAGRPTKPGSIRLVSSSSTRPG